MACMSLFTVAAQKQDSTTYAVVIQFQSMCCGVPDDAPLRSFINSFKKRNKLKKITAWHIGPMGKEGEYWLAFPLKEMKAKQMAAFKKQAKEVTGKLKNKGAASYEENMVVINSALPGRAVVEKLVF